MRKLYIRFLRWVAGRPPHHEKLLPAAEIRELEYQLGVVERPPSNVPPEFNVDDPQSKGWTIQLARTAEKVRQIQRDAGLPMDGIVGPMTEKAMKLSKDPIVAQFLRDRIDLEATPPPLQQLRPALGDIWSHMTAQEEQFAIQEGNW